MFISLFTILTGCNTRRDSFTSSTGANTHICEEDCVVLLATPPHNHTYKSTDPAPLFTWDIVAGIPQKFIVEIDYLNDGSYMTGTAVGCNNYLLSESDWKTIIDNAPKTDGVQKIHWRIRIDYTFCTEKEPYYSEWSYFWIESN